ncbi:hypothetical protein MCNS_05100 [Mycobacterium conspicuum]|uniref:Uncharacterized protein n=1 Tax=Mycobacterium conspicuum TaxID=44010 RepID=A0A7I7Y745_9MYCO|nr:hypothetical protein MCNS_05100 [Mycobacterium conspicuum]
MVLWVCAPGVALVADDVTVDVEVDVLVDVDVVLDLLSEPQPTSARLSAAVAIAAVKYFITCISRRWGGTSAVRVALNTSRHPSRTLLAHPSQQNPTRPADLQ